MERLTDSEYAANLKKEIDAGLYAPKDKTMHERYLKLEQYESIGFEPEELRRFMQKEFPMLHVNVRRALDLLLADKRGRCVTFPCDRGDVVYLLDECIMPRIEVGKCKRFSVDNRPDMVHYKLIVEIRDEIGYYYREVFPEDIGKTAFFSREDVEKVIRERGAIWSD